MIGTALAIGGIGSLIGGIGNAAANMSAADRAASLQDKGLQEWLKIQIPDPEQQKLALDRFVQQGELDPKLEQAIKQDPTEFKKIVTSPSNKSAQLRALSELSNIGYEGGLRLQDKAALQDAMLKGQTQDRANRDAIAADMARRGISDSGFSLAAQLSGQQAGADRDAQNSLSIAAKAQERALQSIMGAGDLATKYRTQEFGEKSAEAQAQDAINRFNTSNMQDVQSRNLASQNRAAEMNLAQNQRTADANVNLSNEEQKYNRGLAQQRFENEAKIAAGKSGQYDKLAGTETKKGQSQGNIFSNIGNAAAGVGTSIAQQDYWDNYFKSKK